MEFGFDIKLTEYDFHLYYQKPWEDLSGISGGFIDPDRLLGLRVDFKQQKIISKILYEYIYTKWQSGPGIPDSSPSYPTEEDNYGYPFGGRDDYYNNYIYYDGWTYHDMIIGTPLFYTQARARNFIPDLSDDYGNIVNNRVVGHHFGLQGGYKILNYRLIGTYTRNYGTYAGANKGRFNWASMEDPDFDYEFDPPLDQFYFLMDTQWKINENISGIFQIGYDTGDIYDNLGFHLGIRYSKNVPYALKK